VTGLPSDPVTSALSALTRLLPGRADCRDLSRSWKHDVVAGVTVGVVALPLALAFAIAAGLSPAVGLTTAIVAGLVAAVFGGSDLQVSGPTGAMAVVLLPVVARFGAWAVPTVGRVVAFVPWPVVEGFAVGIAVTIFLEQVPAALGVAEPTGTGPAVVAYRSVASWLDHPTFQTPALVGIVAVLMVGLPRLNRAVPGSLPAVIAGAVIAGAAGWGVTRIGTLPRSLGTFAFPPLGRLPQLLGPALAIAVLAAMESLLSAKVADALTDTTPCDPDRELFGQGLASIASALAGARTRLSAVMHSVTLLIVVLAAGSLVARTPLATLAGVLMVTAVRMVDPSNVKVSPRTQRWPFQAGDNPNLWEMCPT
jgi:SulP family sulfate permease